MKVSDRVLPVLPVRRLSPQDAQRLKAWRRIAREQELPPILLWWLSGLAACLVIDGHDRLAATLAKGCSPTFLTLARSDAEREQRDVAASVADYEKSVELLERNVGRGSAKAERALVVKQQELAAGLRRAQRGDGRSTAWPLVREDWEETARRQAPDWLDRVSVDGEKAPFCRPGRKQFARGE